MPLIKRNIEPRHLCQGALPEGITSELECVTNSTLAAIIRQLSSLSKHAEDIFGELFNEANNFYIRANSLQDRIDRLSVKVTQLDSTVEEVSLQDINMKKAFKSSTIQDQQVVSKSSIPNPIADIYNQSDKPPPLNILTSYRDDKKDGLKFYTDPSYFFDLWKEKMLQDTEHKRKEKRRQKDQKRIDGTTREVKKVRKARNRRQEWNMMAYDKELRPDNRSHASDITSYSYPATPNHSLHHQLCYVPSCGTGDGSQFMLAKQGLEHEYRLSSTTVQHATLNRPQEPPPPPPQILDGALGTVALIPADYGMIAAQMVDYYNSTGGPAPASPLMIPSAQTAFVSPLQIPVLPTHAGLVAGTLYSGTLHLPPTGHIVTAPAPPGPPPLPPGPPAGSSLSSSPLHTPAVAEVKMQESIQSPISGARSDLLAAIRMGIQLKKVQEQREQEAKHEPVGNDVATILSRRIAVEYSDSDDESECDENDWGQNKETYTP
ncbi:Wiskott-Aldrich syndrome protein family member 3, partial [Ophiophagus hannah]